MLTDGDLEYMRAVQSDARPRAAELIPRGEESDGMGGTTTTDGSPEQITLRVDSRDSRTPDALVAQYAGNIVTLTMDHDVAVRDGDRVAVSEGEAYEVVSEGDPDEWVTAQRVYATRRVWPEQ